MYFTNSKFHENPPVTLSHCLHGQTDKETMIKTLPPSASSRSRPEARYTLPVCTARLYGRYIRVVCTRLNQDRSVKVSERMRAITIVTDGSVNLWLLCRQCLSSTRQDSIRWRTMAVSNVTRLPGIIWEEAALPPLVTDSLIAATNNRSTVFARWHQCACPSNTRFLGPTGSTNQNGISIESAVFPEFTVVTDRQTDRQYDDGAQPIPIAAYAISATWPKSDILLVYRDG